MPPLAMAQYVDTLSVHWHTALPASAANKATRERHSPVGSVYTESVESIEPHWGEANCRAGSTVCWATRATTPPQPLPLPSVRH